MLAMGALSMFRALRAPAAEFDRAKQRVVAGATLGFGVWFVGFMVVGGEFLAMWQSETWNGQDSAFRFYMSLLAVLIFVNQRDSDPASPAPRLRRFGRSTMFVGRG